MPPAPELLDGTYHLLHKLGQGGTATVHFAAVDHEAFDYVKLYAYTQVQGRTHAERIARSEEFAVRLRQAPLDRATMRAILEAHRIPLPGDHVAVKLASPGVDPVRFENEWKYLICLDHPNVIQVYGGGPGGGRPYYAMESLRVLDHHAMAKELDLRERISCVLQAARGLAYLHGVGILHRDVKPGNILLFRREDGPVGAKVTDLGCAAALEEVPDASAQATITGTPHYMAPEQVRPPVACDARTDVYAIGATLLYFATGRLPRAGQGTPREIIRVLRDGRPVDRARVHAPDMPETLAGIVDKALAMDPAARYQDMAGFAGDLERFLELAGPHLAGKAAFGPGACPKLPVEGFLFAKPAPAPPRTPAPAARPSVRIRAAGGLGRGGPASRRRGGSDSMLLAVGAVCLLVLAIFLVRHFFPRRFEAVFQTSRPGAVAPQEAGPAR